MKVLDPGHEYLLDVLDDDGRGVEPRTLVFVKREGPGYPGNNGHHAGTNLQEVLRAMIERVKYLDGQIAHKNNAGILANLRHSLWLLEQRAAERHGRAFDISWGEGIEELSTCPGCGHIGCEGQCGHAGRPPSRFPDHIDSTGNGHYLFRCGKCNAAHRFAASDLRDGWPVSESPCCGSGAWTSR